MGAFAMARRPLSRRLFLFDLPEVCSGTLLTRVVRFEGGEEPLHFPLVWGRLGRVVM